MSNTIRIVNLSTSPVAVPLFTDVVDSLEDRSDVQKTVNADDLVLTGLPALGVAAFVDGAAVGADVQERTASAVLVAADLVDGGLNLIVADASAAPVTITLPLTTTLAAGTQVWIYAANVDNALNVDDNAADTIDGGAGPVALTPVGSVIRLSNDAVSNWDNIDT